MSKPIRITEAFLQEIKKDFEATLRSLKMSDGKVSYTKQFVWTSKEDDIPILEFTPLAYVKMVSLLQHYSSEVAWHGTVTRDPDNPLHFVIEDILVYPQQVDGTNVNTDQKEYTQWLYAQEDEIFDTIRMQGHSHVNMGTSPSSVDLTHQEEILNQLEDDMFYIFMIWNKRLEHTVKIYDLASNTLYEDADIDLVCPTLDSFLEEADQMVKKKVYTPAKSSSPQKTTGYSGYSGWPYYGKQEEEDEDDFDAIYGYGYGTYEDLPQYAGKKRKGKRNR